jgi:hypothetical protein
METALEPGMIGFSNNKKGGFLIRFFTRSNITHSFVLMFPLNGITAVEEASASVQIVPFEPHYTNNPNEDYYLYRIRPEYASPDAVVKALTRVFEEFAGVKYGWLQLLWFPYRWFKETILRQKNVHREKNWFTRGVICSELQYWYLIYLHPVFTELLKDYDGDTIEPSDLLDVVKANPHIFEFVISKPPAMSKPLK